MNYTAPGFGSAFKWGVSTAAYQVEGAYNLDGKGTSIWDVFANTKGKVFANHNGNVSCDFYHRYAQDIALMSIMNIPNFRFSLSWSRILPKGTGIVNLKGIDFYHRVIDFCLELHIDPWITLYHWDLPYELENKGGWTNRDIINWFGEYVQVCIKAFGSKVKNWMVMNEPMVFTGAGYFLGIHAPGRTGLNNFLSSAHHAALCQAEGGRIIRSMKSDSYIGSTFSCSYIQPFRNTEQDIGASLRVDALVNRLFIEPLLGLNYPVKEFKMLQRLEKYIEDGDESKLKFDMDFVGVQNYTRELVASSPYKPFIWAKIIPAEKRKVPTTLMNWEVYPECIYHMLQRFNSYANVKQIIVTENGAAFTDTILNGEIYDIKRQAYLEQHIAQVLKAKQEGVKVAGYFVWSFTDNFEWAEGYKPAFGLVHVDFTSQKRTIKYSGKWYSKLVTSLLSDTLLFDNLYA